MAVPGPVSSLWASRCCFPTSQESHVCLGRWDSDSQELGSPGKRWRLTVCAVLPVLPLGRWIVKHCCQTGTSSSLHGVCKRQEEQRSSGGILVPEPCGSVGAARLPGILMEGHDSAWDPREPGAQRGRLEDREPLAHAVAGQSWPDRRGLWAPAAVRPAWPGAPETPEVEGVVRVWVL